VDPPGCARPQPREYADSGADAVSGLSECDPAFLDWIFWWYLGTVKLTNRIISRQEGKGG